MDHDDTRQARQAMLRRILEKRGLAAPAGDGEIPESAYRFEKFARYQQMRLHDALARRAGVRNPFFHLHQGIARDTTVIDDRRLLNFSTYNYLGLNGDPRVTEAAAAAARTYGTSASASRLVSGERPPHRALEAAIARLLGTEDAVAFVSGHATNVATIGCLLGKNDLVVYDRLIHNSVVQGAALSGAARHAFAHNDCAALDRYLDEHRHRFEKVLIVVEGLYGMDGDLCPLPALIDIRRRHKALLMVDEAHSMGAVGASGRGVGEHFGVSADDVDIWMGTLSKTFAGCGGYIAGSAPLVEMLKFGASGFVYSVGMPPPIAAAATRAIEIMLAEPERVARLHENGALFLARARARGLDTGLSAGFNVVPVVTGRSATAALLSNALGDRGINVQPIIYPAVEEGAARLRFFLSSDHVADQIEAAVDATAEELARLRAEEGDTP